MNLKNIPLALMLVFFTVAYWPWGALVLVPFLIFAINDLRS